MFLACRACWVLIGRLTALFAYHHHCPLVDDWIGTSCCHVSESSLNCPWLHLSLRTIVRIYDVGSMACNFHNPTHTFSQDKITSSIINSHATPFDGPHSTQSSTATQHCGTNPRRKATNSYATPSDEPPSTQSSTTSPTKPRTLLSPLPPPTRTTSPDLRTRLHLRQRALPGRPLEGVRAEWKVLPARHPPGPDTRLQTDAHGDSAPANGAERDGMRQRAQRCGSLP